MVLHVFVAICHNQHWGNACSLNTNDMMRECNFCLLQLLKLTLRFNESGPSAIQLGFLNHMCLEVSLIWLWFFTVSIRVCVTTQLLLLLQYICFSASYVSGLEQMFHDRNWMDRHILPISLPPACVSLWYGQSLNLGRVQVARRHSCFS